MTRILFALLIVTLALPAAAQPLPRVKGKVLDFDGLTFHLESEKGEKLAIRLQARTQFMTLAKQPASAIKTGAYAGATVADSDGILTAEEVHLYPEPMRGSSEGRIGLGDGRFVITGTVKASAAGSLTLSYRGGAMTDGVCQGRADPNAASPACAAEAVIQVPPEARIAALTPANRRQLVPGAIATVTIQTDARGARSTPGLILEKP
jgi:hypothetical protein